MTLLCHVYAALHMSNAEHQCSMQTHIWTACREKNMQLALIFQPDLFSADSALEGNVPTRKSWDPWTQLLKGKAAMLTWTPQCSNSSSSRNLALTTPKTSLFLTGHRDLAGFSSRSQTLSSGFQLNTVVFWLNSRVKEKQITSSQFWFFLPQPGHLTGCQNFWTFKLHCVLQLWLLPSYSWRFQEQRKHRI